MLNEPGTVLAAIHRFATAAALTDWSIQIPDALLAFSNDRLNKGHERFSGVGIYRSIIGTHDGGTWKVDLTEPANPKVGSRQAFLQRLTGRDGNRHHDLRIYIVDGDIAGAMYCYAPENDRQISTVPGGDVLNTTDEMPDETKQAALCTVEMMEMDHVGVDLVEGDDGWFVLEANPTTGFKGLYQVTGKSPAPYIVEPTIGRTGGEADETHVEGLSTTLNDSVPSCIPNELPIIDDETPLIGHIEEIVIDGTSGSQQALTRSDTGTTRTNIDTNPTAEVGARLIKSAACVRSGSFKSGKTYPVIDLVIGIGSIQYTMIISIEGHSHMGYPLLFSRDTLEHYRVDVRRHASAGRNDSGGEEEKLLEG